MSIRGKTICPVCGRTVKDPSGMHRWCWFEVNADSVGADEYERFEHRQAANKRKRQRRKEECERLM